MQVRIGIRESARELAFESDQSASEVEKLYESALKEPGGLLKLSDSKGVIFLVAASAVSYLELGASTERRVGFIG